MFRYLTMATAGFAVIAGFASAQETQTTTESHATSSTAPVSKGKESFEWSVDTTTTKVPVRPQVVEQTTTKTIIPVAPPPVVNEHTNTTTTTTTGDQ